MFRAQMRPIGRTQKKTAIFHCIECIEEQLIYSVIAKCYPVHRATEYLPRFARCIASTNKTIKIKFFYLPDVIQIGHCLFSFLLRNGKIGYGYGPETIRIFQL